MLQSLMLRVQPRKGGQQRRMDIQNALGKFADEMAAQDPHVARQADQIHTASPQFVDQLAIVHFPIEAL